MKKDMANESWMHKIWNLVNLRELNLRDNQLPCSDKIRHDIPLKIYPCNQWIASTFPPQPNKGKAIFYIYQKGEGLNFANGSDKILNYVVRDGYVRKEYPRKFDKICPNEAVLFDVYGRITLPRYYFNSLSRGLEYYRGVENGMFSSQVILWEKTGITRRWRCIGLAEKNLKMK